MKKYLNKNSAKEFLWVAIGNTINILGLLVTIKLFTKKLPQSEYGIYYLSLTVSLFVNQIFFGPLGNAIARYLLISKSENDTSNLLSDSFSIFKKCIFLLSFFYVLTILVLIYISGYKFIILTTSTFLFSIFTGSSSIISSLQNINRERKNVAVFQILDSIFKIIFIFIFLKIFNNDANIVSIASTSSSLILLVLQIFYIKFSNNQLCFVYNNNATSNWTKKLYSYSLPFSIWGIFTWAQISSDRWFLEKFSDTNSIAKYAVLYQIGFYPLTILMGYIVQTITPILFNRAGNGTDKAMIKNSTMLNLKVSIVSIFITIIGFIIIYLLQDELTALLTSSKYFEVSKYLPIMLLSGGLFATSQILSLDFLSQIKINDLMFIKIFTSILGIFFSFYLIKFNGFSGAVYSNFSFSIVYLITILFIVIIRLRKSNEENIL